MKLAQLLPCNLALAAAGMKVGSRVQAPTCSQIMGTAQVSLISGLRRCFSDHHGLAPTPDP